ncbi:hypothetical protein ACFQDD_11790 [Halorubrum pallidum]|uniref:Uncharacterized protein n=1 Tax=Halorubrum pallidum TaxID=1526114 RepID=A0ABD5T4H0_9EURY
MRTIGDAALDRKWTRADPLDYRGDRSAYQTVELERGRSEAVRPDRET